VIGQSDEGTGAAVASLYHGLPGPVIRTDTRTAEMVKYVDNIWHALKVGFGNEVGNICKALGIDGHAVMDIFCQDTKLNLSPYYLKPGFAFGGSCLPKDLRALTYKGRMLDLDLPILNAISPSNDIQIKRAFDMVMATGARKIGVLGFSFKAGTDDLRESPVVELIERLLGKGSDLLIYDRNVNLAKLFGANREYILNRIPHISGLMAADLDQVLEHGDLLIIGNGDAEFEGIPGRLKDGQRVLDLVRISAQIPTSEGYDGICW
jgi:GDP-mannose 6-dehydrogenase